MSLLDSLKQAFGFGPAQPAPTPADSPMPAAEQPLPAAGGLPPASPAPQPAPGAPAGLPPAGQLRERLLRFVLDALHPYQNEPDNAPIALRLAILAPAPDETELYRVALWAAQPGKFQRELSRQLADQYIQLPPDWQFDYTFYTDALPDTSVRSGNLGLQIEGRRAAGAAPQLARLTTLVGQTEHDTYTLDPSRQTSYCIGRGQQAQTTAGRVRHNDIVILNDDDPAFDPARGTVNGAVSRAHAHIAYDPKRHRYSLLVDAGGLPASGNKTKVFHPNDTMERADIAGMSYPLDHGDQIELGGAVMLLFELV